MPPTADEDDDANPTPLFSPFPNDPPPPAPDAAAPAAGAPAPAPPSRRSRFAGAVLGAAIGDAMGHPTEFLSMAAIRDRYGPDGVRGFELYWDRGGHRFAPYTDDTQMAECVLRALLDDRDDLDAAMRGMARRFVDWAERPQGGHRAPGNACLAGCRALARGAHWAEAGGPTAGGCGSVMRAYPFGLVFCDDLDKAERWAVEHSKLTHRDPIALAASAAMAVGVARAIRGEEPLAIASEMLAAACRHSPPTAVMVAEAIGDADAAVGPDQTLDRLRAWAAHEAIAAAIYVFLRHPDDPAAAVLEAANTPGDSDSIATLAGALTGARRGVEALPPDWVRDVERADELRALADRI
jgi:ADP-ribosylglycohydrolase